MSFIIVDAYGFLFRAYHSLPPLTNPEGQNIGAIYGMLNMLIKLINDQNPTHVVVALDSGRKTFRHDIYQEYKSNRPEPPEDLKQQFDVLKDLLDAMNLHYISIPGVEADDIIASISKQMANINQSSIIVSSDKDLMQLLQNNHIKMYDAMKSTLVGPEQVHKKFGVSPAHVLDYLSLVGDASDFVPGVRGIGAKSAENLINQYNNLEGIYDNLDSLKPRQKTLLEEGRENAFLSRRLIQLKDDLEFDSDNIKQFKFDGFENDKLGKFLQAMGFHSVIKRLNIQISAPSNTQNSNNSMQNNALQMKERQYKTLKIQDINDKFIKQIYRDGEIFIMHHPQKLMKDSSKNHPNESFLTLSTRNLCVQFKLSSAGGNLLQVEDDSCTLHDIFSAIIQPLIDDSIKVILLHSRPIYEFLRDKLNQILTNFDDLNIMSYLLNCGKFKHEEFEVLSQNGCENFNSESIMYCYKLLNQQLHQQKLLAFYLEIERKIAPLVYKMEALGVHIDKDALDNLSAEFVESLNTLEQEIFKICGEQFNIASPKQLGHILFDKMNLPHGKKSKAGAYVTNLDILEKLEDEGFEICRHILNWRHLSKLLNTYTRALPNYLSNIDNRLHTKFQLTNTTTGRFSSQDPNLQNIPIRTTEGAKIRKAFSARPGYVIVSADYSQIELRLLAHIADIKQMQDAINSGQDIHKATALELFGNNNDASEGEIRRKAKAINFGIIYGISAFGLAKRLGISNKSAQEYIDMYFQKFPGIKEYMENSINFCRQNGYVKTLFGRKCYITNINSKNHNLRSFSERAAINAPLQGTVADIMKKAMIYLPDEVKNHLILQIHDELLFEVPKADVEKFATSIKRTMEGVAQFSVDLKTDISYANSWYDTK